GANGAGKSTLLRILATLLVPTAGHARVGGHDTVHHSRDVRRCLGYHAGTDHGFYPRLTARQNLLFFGRLNLLSNAAASQRISARADRVSLLDAGRLLACDTPSALKRSTRAASLEDVFLRLTGRGAGSSERSIAE